MHDRRLGREHALQCDLVEPAAQAVGQPVRSTLGDLGRESRLLAGAFLSLQVLGTVVPREEAAPYAAALGKAFQLTNFLRDVDEDLDRGRVYLPADELAAHGVDRELLMWCHTTKRTDTRVRNALAEQHAVTRRMYDYARHGVDLLHPRSRACVGVAAVLYSEILDRIEAIDFDIFNQRATVGNGRRLHVAGVGLLRAWRARIAHPAKV